MAISHDNCTSRALAYINPDPWPSFASCQHEVHLLSSARDISSFCVILKVLTTALQVHRKALEGENNENVVLHSTLDLLRILKVPSTRFANDLLN